MLSTEIRFGSRIAPAVRTSSRFDGPRDNGPRTVGQVLDILAQEPPRHLRMLRTTCAILARYLGVAPLDLELAAAYDARRDFRIFLEQRRYAANSIRTYINHLGILFRHAANLGWSPESRIPPGWRQVLALAEERKCLEVAEYLAKLRAVPAEVTTEDIDGWIASAVSRGRSLPNARRHKHSFIGVLSDAGEWSSVPKNFSRERLYSVPLQDFPRGLRSEVDELLRWKQAAFSIDRPKDGQHRAISAHGLREAFCALYGFARNCGEQPRDSLSDLVQKPLVGAWVEWRLNERQVKGETVLLPLRLMYAAMRHHPRYKKLDLAWFESLMNSVPVEPKSARQARKSEKYLDYGTLESIPRRLRESREQAISKGDTAVARLAMYELLVKWFITLPWRQRNVRECRIAGPRPNLFKRRIPLFSEIDKPAWAVKEELENASAEFWQFHFSPDETKTGIEVKALLPRQLVPLLEAYLSDFRPNLLTGRDPLTLFVNTEGRSMSRQQINLTVSELTLRYGGRRVTPHRFRDIVAFTWLKEHPQDYLTLSKMLWHSNINTTIGIYGGRFNESSGVRAMEGWLESRQASQ